MCPSHLSQREGRDVTGSSWTHQNEQELIQTPNPAGRARGREGGAGRHDLCPSLHPSVLAAPCPGTGSIPAWLSTDFPGVIKRPRFSTEPPPSGCPAAAPVSPQLASCAHTGSTAGGVPWVPPEPAEPPDPRLGLLCSPGGCSHSGQGIFLSEHPQGVVGASPASSSLCPRTSQASSSSLWCPEPTSPSPPAFPALAGTPCPPTPFPSLPAPPTALVFPGEAPASLLPPLFIATASFAAPTAANPKARQCQELAEGRDGARGGGRAQRCSWARPQLQVTFAESFPCFVPAFPPAQPGAVPER